MASQAPHLDGPVQAAGDDPLHVPCPAVQGKAGHGVIVAAKHRSAVASIQLPHTDGLIATATTNKNNETNFTLI